MADAPDTLPADFFSKQQSVSAPATLPANFFSKSAPVATPPQKQGFWSSLYDQTAGPLVHALSPENVSGVADAMSEGLRGNMLPAARMARDVAAGIVHGSADQLRKAGSDIKTAFDGSPGVMAPALASAAIHTAGAVPVIGQALVGSGEKAGHQIEQGDYLGALGTAGGAIGMQLLPKAGEVSPVLGEAAEIAQKPVTAARDAIISKLSNNAPRPLSPEAQAMAGKLGVTLSAADISGSKFTQSAQKIAASVVAPDIAEAHAAQAEAGLQKGVNALTGDFATDQFAAGDNTLQNLVAHSKQHAGVAGGAYNDLAALEADPANQVTVTQGVKPGSAPAVGGTSAYQRAMQSMSGDAAPQEAAQVPVTEKVGLPVDTSPARKLLEPVRQSILRKYPIGQQQMDQGLHAISNILDGPRYVPASVAEDFLSAVKKLQRDTVGPNKLLAGQAIDAMSPLVDQAVSQAGPGALQTLQDGRAAWKEHMDTEDLIGKLAGDDTSGATGQVTAVQRLIQPADQSFPLLQRVLDKTPDAAGPLGQAALARVFKQAADGGEFTNPKQAANLFNQLGSRTKAALFDPQQLSDVKATLDLAKRLAENPNPSGTGSLNAMAKMGMMVLHPFAGVATLALGRPFARALFNPQGAAALRTALTGGADAPAAVSMLKNIVDSPAAAPAAVGGAVEGASPVEAAPAAAAPASSATQILIPGGQPYNAQYVARDLDAVQGSHNSQTFAPNPKFTLKNQRDYDNPVNRGKIVENSTPDKFDPRHLISTEGTATGGPPIIDGDQVLGGNGRKAILDRAYARDPQGALGYRQAVLDQASQFGIDPASLAGMKKPAIFRKLNPGALGTRSQSDAFADFNKTGTAALTPEERAISDSKRVSQGTLDDIAQKLDAKGPDSSLMDILSGDGGHEIVRNLVKDGALTTEELAGLQGKAGLTKDGKNRVSMLMLGRFFDDPAHLQNMAPAMRNKLERVAAPLARVEGSDYDLSTPMQHAIALLEETKSHGLKDPAAMASQYSDLFRGNSKYSPESVTLAKALQSVKPVDMAKRVQAYVDHARYAQQYQGPGMFGEFPNPVAPADALAQTVGAQR